MSTMKCPFCAEEIKPEAIKCKHCGKLLLFRKCPFCLEKIGDDIKICPYCESNLENPVINIETTKGSKIMNKVSSVFFAICNWIIGITLTIWVITNILEITKSPVKSIIAVLMNFIVAAIFLPPTKKYIEIKFNKKINWKFKLIVFIIYLIIKTII